MDQYTETQTQTLQMCCPTQVFQIDETSKAIYIDRAADCIFCKECIFLLEDYRRAPEDKLGVEIKHSTNKFTFTVETTGSLTPKEVFKEALKALNDKMLRLRQLANNLHWNGTESAFVSFII